MPPDVFFSDSPRYLTFRYEPNGVSAKLLQNAMKGVPKRKPDKKTTPLRDFSWLLQKLTDCRLEKSKIAETVVLLKGKPLKVFRFKDGKVNNIALSASSQLYGLFRVWVEGTYKRSSGTEATVGAEICTLQFKDGAIRTLAEDEIRVLLKSRKPTRSKWEDTKLVQLLPNAGATFLRPMRYITYQYERKLCEVKHGLRTEAEADIKELKVEEAVNEINDNLSSLIITQGLFHFAQTDTMQLYLIGATKLVVLKKQFDLQKKDVDVEDVGLEEIDWSKHTYFDKEAFWQEVVAYDKKPHTQYMGEVLQQLQTNYTILTAKARGLKEPPRKLYRCSDIPKAINSTTSVVGEVSSLNGQSLSLSTVSAAKETKYFCEDPPVCPDSPRKPSFTLPPRPKSVCDLLRIPRTSSLQKSRPNTASGVIGCRSMSYVRAGPGDDLSPSSRAEDVPERSPTRDHPHLQSSTLLTDNRCQFHDVTPHLSAEYFLDSSAQFEAVVSGDSRPASRPGTRRSNHSTLNTTVPVIMNGNAELRDGPPSGHGSAGVHTQQNFSAPAAGAGLSPKQEYNKDLLPSTTHPASRPLSRAEHIRFDAGHGAAAPLPYERAAALSRPASSSFVGRQMTSSLSTQGGGLTQGPLQTAGTCSRPPLTRPQSVGNLFYGAARTRAGFAASQTRPRSSGSVGGKRVKKERFIVNSLIPKLESVAA